eukprot:308420_1
MSVSDFNSPSLCVTNSCEECTTNKNNYNSHCTWSNNTCIQWDECPDCPSIKPISCPNAYITYIPALFGAAVFIRWCLILYFFARRSTRHGNRRHQTGLRFMLGYTLCFSNILDIYALWYGFGEYPDDTSICPLESDLCSIDCPGTEHVLMDAGLFLRIGAFSMIGWGAIKLIVLFGVNKLHKRGDMSKRD